MAFNFKQATIDRFMSLFERVDGCWEWQGKLSWNGYGSYNGKVAHRIVYEQIVGPIPTGMTLDHTCRNRKCVNPAHMEPITLRENLLRSPRWNSDHCKHGHPFGEQSNYYKSKGLKRCHECHRIREQKRRVSA